LRRSERKEWRFDDCLTKALTSHWNFSGRNKHAIRCANLTYVVRFFLSFHFVIFLFYRYARNFNSCMCSSTELRLSNDSMIEIKNVRAIAFAQLDKPEFSKQQVYEQCARDSRTSDIVPIVVGACLAGLVIIVLVAYLIGRARAKRQGY
uniref:ZP domain-containing protein n=1 Tax=Angiostrongylus cantonensis TaxID=6313 RepID=A0A0K0D788_ANGCA